MKKFFEWFKKRKYRSRLWFIKLFMLIIGFLGLLVLLGYNHMQSQIEIAKRDFRIEALEAEKEGKNKEQDDQIAKMGNVLQQFIEKQKAMYGNESIYAKDIWSYTPEEIAFYINAPERTKELVEVHGTQNYKLYFPWMVFPVEGYVVKLGEFATSRGGFPHTGFDIVPVESRECISAADGIVAKIGNDNLGGYYIIIATERPGYKQPICNYYGHLEKIEVEEGQEVKQKDRVGIVGNTGDWCFGVHLHWSIKIGNILYNPVINTTWYNRIEVKLYKREGY